MIWMTSKFSPGRDQVAGLSDKPVRSGPPSLTIIAGVLLMMGAVESRAVDFYGDAVATGSISDDSVSFHDRSSAGSASITLSPYMFSGSFFDSSTAANASIIVDGGAGLYFEGNSTAAASSISVRGEGYLEFNGQAGAGAANISVDDSSYLYFLDNSTPDGARLTVDGRAVLYETLGPNGDGVVTVGSLAGTGEVEIGGDIEQNNIVLRVGGNDDSTSFSGAIYGGAGSTLVKTGSGVFTLDSTASLGSFDSAIVVEQGLINFTSSEALGTGRITLTGGGLQWASGTTTDISSRLEPLGAGGGVFDTNGNDVYLGSAISGSGALTKTGAGLLALTQASTYTGGTLINGGRLLGGAAGALPSGTAYTINGGTLDLGSYDLAMSSLSGTGGGIALGTGTLTVDQGTDTTYAGEISGSGGLLKTGSGRLNLTGASTYTGPTDITGGTLAVNGSLDPASVVSVRDGGTLGGNGAVGSVVVYGGGTIAPGNSIGTLYVNGDLIFTPGAVYSVETDAAGNADRLVVSGMVSLDGTLQVLAGSGTYAPATNYSIISTTSGSPISGSFASVTSNLAFLDPSLTYTASGVTLTVTRNDISFVSQALTPNQIAFASSLATLGSNNPVYRTIINLSSEQAANMYSQLSGDAHASMSATLVYSDIDVMNAPLQNLRSNLDSPASALPMWAQASSGSQRMDDDGNAGATTQDFNGALIGGDLPAFGDWRLGAAVGYDIAQLSVGSRETKGDTRTGRYALYGGRAFELGDDNSLRVFGGLAYSLHRLESTRDVILIDGPERLTRSYDVATTQVFGEVAYRFVLGEDAHVEPFVGLMKVDQRADAFQEEGGSAALAGDSQHNSLVISSFGARGQHMWKPAGLELLLKGSVTWRHLDGDVQPELGLRLSGGERYTVLGTELPRDSLMMTLNANYDVAAGVVLNVGVNAMTSDSGNAAALVANLRWKMQ